MKYFKMNLTKYVWTPALKTTNIPQEKNEGINDIQPNMHAYKHYVKWNRTDPNDYMLC